MYHFGINIDNNEKLTKEKYIDYLNNHQSFSLEDILFNFDKNMKYFQNLNKEDFENELSKFLKKFKKFREIFDLQECNCYGFYIMVLDNYKQVYIGIADNIKKRIIQHWKKKPHALIYGNKNNSKLCIDSFKALDTTRIFIFKDESYENNLALFSFLYPSNTSIEHISGLFETEEAKMIMYFNNKYTCNRYIREYLRSGKNQLYRDFNIQ